MRMRWLYALAALPFLAEFAETGRWPSAPREAVTDVVLAVAIAGLAALACRQARRAATRADTDAVTGLFNSARFHADLEREIMRAERLNAPLTLVYIGLDNFKAVNDALGRAEGDALLRHFAKILVQNVRVQVDRCYRAGGDEFALILPSTEVAGAEVVLERIRRASSAEPCTLPRHGVGISAGAAQLQKGETPRALLLRADSLMYDAKRSGKSGIRV
jgi:diguanylate cyclase (GGDEF)-like protein